MALPPRTWLKPDLHFELIREFYFIGYLLGGELDVVHECLLCLVVADVHHLFDGVLVGKYMLVIRCVLQRACRPSPVSSAFE